MTSPPEDTPDHQSESRSPPAAAEGPSNPVPADAAHASATSPASTVPLPEGAGPVGPLVEDIKERLADLSGRESELRHREDEVAQQQRLLEGHAREGPAEDLEAQAAELKEQRRQLDEQRAAIEETLRTLAEREAADARRHAELRRRLAEKLDLIRRRKSEFIEKVRLAQAELKRRKLALARDRQKLDQQAGALDQRRVALERRVADLETRAREVDARTEALQPRLEELERAAAALDERRRSLAEQEAEAAARARDLDEKEAKLQRRGDALEARARELEQRAEASEAQRAELDSRRREIEPRESELRDRDDELRVRAQQLDGREQELDARAAQFESEAAALRSHAAEVEQSQAELRVRAAELDADRMRLDELARSLERRKAQLGTREVELAENQRLVSGFQDALARQREELNVWERALEERQAALAERTGQLDEREKGLNERSAAVEARCDEVVQREAEIEKRRASVDKLYQQATETRERAQSQQQEAAALLERAEAREAELRRESLQTEIDRERVQRDCATLVTEQEELARLQAEVERRADRYPEAELPEEPAPAISAAPGIPRATLWRRGLALGGVAGLAAALVWFVVEQPRYRGLAEIRIASQRGSSEQIAGEHADWLMSDAVADYWQGPPPVETWRAVGTAQRVWARPLPASNSVRLALETADAGLAETLLPAAARAYCAYVEDLPLERFRCPRMIEWNERKAALSDELSRRRDRRRELQARLAEVPASLERKKVQEAFDKALDEFKQVVARLREQRAELLALQSQELPRGEVPAEAYQQGLAEDPLYQEDLKEFRSQASRYQTELVVSMVLLIDPLRELRESVQGLAATMVEQRDLRPPPDVRTLLEQCLAQVSDFDDQLAQFSQAWTRHREAIERLEASEQVVELLKLQQQVVDAVRELTEEARRVLGEVETGVEKLGAAGKAGTRALVVASALHGYLSRSTARVDALAQIAGMTDPSVNFRLDAHDRQVRALRARLGDRRQRVREMLQAEADRTAGAKHAEQERQLRERLGEAEQQRQTLMDAFVTNLERLRALDEQHQELRELSVELEAEEAAVTRLEARLAEQETERPESLRDRVELARADHEQIAGADRLRNAGVAGAVTFAAAGLLLLLMFAPRSRREVDAEGPTDDEPALVRQEDTRRAGRPHED